MTGTPDGPTGWMGGGGFGGGQPDFPKAAKVAKPSTKHKGMHVLTPCEDEHRSIISWVVMLLLAPVTFPLHSPHITTFPFY